MIKGRLGPEKTGTNLLCLFSFVLLCLFSHIKMVRDGMRSVEHSRFECRIRREMREGGREKEREKG